jgi:hypothetical protein
MARAPARPDLQTWSEESAQDWLTEAWDGEPDAFVALVARSASMSELVDAIYPLEVRAETRITGELQALDRALRAFLPQLTGPERKLPRDVGRETLRDAIARLLASPVVTGALPPVPATRAVAVDEHALLLGVENFLSWADPREGPLPVPGSRRLDLVPGDRRLLDWIERFWTAQEALDRASRAPIDGQWGDLAARSDIEWDRIERWCARSPSLLRVALGALFTEREPTPRAPTREHLVALLSRIRATAPPMFTRQIDRALEAPDRYVATG